MASLYEINSDYIALMNMLDEGEYDEQTIRDTLESIEGDFENKADNIAYIISELEGRIATRAKEVDRLIDANDSDKNKIEKLKKMLFSSMELRQMPKFETAYHKFSIAKNGGSLPLVFRDGQPKGENVPDGFRKVKTDISVDTEAVRKALDAGEQLEWVKYGERGSSLRIK